ncbi:MAG: hypothetical protein IKS71_07815 [Bacteroidales bacterium]|nr:hypothetical protein [Bacteroidales bacterium]
MDLKAIVTIADCDREISIRENYLKTNNVPPFVVTTLQKEIAELNTHKAKLTGPISIYDSLKTKIGYSQPLQQCIKEAFDHLTDPKVDDPTIPGLLLGRIQSGKTRAFVGIMAMAFDNGFDACVVLTKPDDGLVMQTKARMENDFKDFLDTSCIYNENVVAVYNVEKSITLSPLQCCYKNIFVLHKNRRLVVMKKVLDSYFQNKKVLIIDDEADFVSRTYYVKQKSVVGGVTGFRIDDLTSNPLVSCYYLQVTATPYSLLLQPNETIDVKNGVLSCFHPRFTVLVPTHDRYVGGKQYFERALDPQSMYSYLFHPISDICLDRLLSKNEDQRITRNAATHIYFQDLRDALMSYFVGSSIRREQEFTLHRVHYKTSFLIHCAIEKDDHLYEKKILDIILNAWRRDVLQQNTAQLRKAFDKAYDDFIDSNRAGNNCIDPAKNKKELNNLSMPSRTDVWDDFLSVINQTGYSVQCINGDTTDDPNLYEKDGQLKLPSFLNIFIGGFKADRGITIDNMIAFMYGRRTKNGGSANTILQHMRQYGNRSEEDLSVTRFHTTYALYDKLKDIYNTDESLRDFFANNATPTVTYIDYDPTTATYRLCSPQQTRMSSLRAYGKFGRLIATPGFQTGNAATISPTIQSIDKELTSAALEKTPFKMDKADAYRILNLIKSTLIYSGPTSQWDPKTMVEAIEKFGHQDGQIWAYYATNRNLARLKKNGRFEDAPEDGKTDTPIATAYATDRPFLMFIKENGDRTIGWNGTPFYWPVLRLPNNIQPNIFCDGAINAPRQNAQLVVTLPDGSTINKGGVQDTLIECIKIANPQTVQNLNIQYRKNNLVFSAGRCPNGYSTIIAKQYYLRKGINSQQAVKFLNDISSKLNLGWNISLQ